MAYLRSTLANLTTLALATAAIGTVVGERLPKSGVWAQVSEPAPPTFPIPNRLPANATLTIDGSPSMTVANEAFRQRLQQQFPEVQVELNASRTDTALQRLLAGELDIVAAGRPLTPEEQAQGLTEVPITREKIAIIVGPDNGFTGDLAFDQFAQMFYGDITNWSAVGGPAVPIRVVDRPEHSDTRQAISQYPVFVSRTFTPGPTVTPIREDSTDAVIAALGNDGIGYAVVSQVQGRGDVRILAMNATLPNDPRYPYSQPRFYVYNSQNPSPAALAFLGIATTAPGQAVRPAIGASPVDSAATPPTATSATPPAATPDTTDPATPEAVPSSPADAVPPSETTVPTTAEATAPVTAEQSTTLLPTPGGTATEKRGFPWWLLGIPFLGGLLWWLMRNQGEAPAAAPLGVGAVVNTAPSRIILTPRNCRRAYAYWEVSDEHRAQERDRGGRNLMLRLLDVTDRDTDRHPPVRIEQFAVTENQPDLHVPIPVDDRDYQVELGYVTGEGHWLPLAKSDPVRVPACPVGDATTGGEEPLLTPSEPDRRWVAEDLTAPTAIVPALDIPLVDGPLAADGSFVASTETLEEATLNPEIAASALAMGGLVSAGAAARVAAKPETDSAPVAPIEMVAAPETSPGTIQTLTVHSRHHTVRLDAGQRESLQNQVAAAHSLEPGSYLIKIKNGAFSYGDPAQPGEPLTLLWIYGGKVTNLKTGVAVNATWSTLNGYADTLCLEVEELAQLRAFFIDTFSDNNLGQVTLSIVRL